MGDLKPGPSNPVMGPIGNSVPIAIQPPSSENARLQLDLSNNLVFPTFDQQQMLPFPTTNTQHTISTASINISNVNRQMPQVTSTASASPPVNHQDFSLKIDQVFYAGTSFHEDAKEKIAQVTAPIRAPASNVVQNNDTDVKQNTGASSDTDLQSQYVGKNINSPPQRVQYPVASHLPSVPVLTSFTPNQIKNILQLPISPLVHSTNLPILQQPVNFVNNAVIPLQSQIPLLLQPPNVGVSNPHIMSSPIQAIPPSVPPQMCNPVSLNVANLRSNIHLSPTNLDLSSNASLTTTVNQLRNMASVSMGNPLTFSPNISAIVTTATISVSTASVSSNVILTPSSNTSKQMEPRTGAQILTPKCSTTKTLTFKNPVRPQKSKEVYNTPPNFLMAQDKRFLLVPVDNPPATINPKCSQVPSAGSSPSIAHFTNEGEGNVRPSPSTGNLRPLHSKPPNGVKKTGTVLSLFQKLKSIKPKLDQINSKGSAIGDKGNCNELEGKTEKKKSEKNPSISVQKSKRKKKNSRAGDLGKFENLTEFISQIFLSTFKNLVNENIVTVENVEKFVPHYSTLNTTSRLVSATCSSSNINTPQIELNGLHIGFVGEDTRTEIKKKVSHPPVEKKLPDSSNQLETIENVSSKVTSGQILNDLSNETQDILSHNNWTTTTNKKEKGSCEKRRKNEKEEKGPDIKKESHNDNLEKDCVNKNNEIKREKTLIVKKRKTSPKNASPTLSFYGDLNLLNHSLVKCTVPLTRLKLTPDELHDYVTYNEKKRRHPGGNLTNQRISLNNEKREVESKSRKRQSHTDDKTVIFAKKRVTDDSLTHKSDVGNFAEGIERNICHSQARKEISVHVVTDNLKLTSFLSSETTFVDDNEDEIKPFTEVTGDLILKEHSDLEWGNDFKRRCSRIKHKPHMNYGDQDDDVDEVLEEDHYQTNGEEKSSNQEEESFVGPLFEQVKAVKSKVGDETGKENNHGVAQERKTFETDVTELTEDSSSICLSNNKSYEHIHKTNSNSENPLEILLGKLKSLSRNKEKKTNNNPRIFAEVPDNNSNNKIDHFIEESVEQIHKTSSESENSFSPLFGKLKSLEPKVCDENGKNNKRSKAEESKLHEPNSNTGFYIVKGSAQVPRTNGSSVDNSEGGINNSFFENLMSLKPEVSNELEKDVNHSKAEERSSDSTMTLTESNETNSDIDLNCRKSPAQVPDDVRNPNEIVESILGKLKSLKPKPIGENQKDNNHINAGERKPVENMVTCTELRKTTSNIDLNSENSSVQVAKTNSNTVNTEKSLDSLLGKLKNMKPKLSDKNEQSGGEERKSFEKMTFSEVHKTNNNDFAREKSFAQEYTTNSKIDKKKSVTQVYEMNSNNFDHNSQKSYAKLSYTQSKGHLKPLAGGDNISKRKTIEEEEQRIQMSTPLAAVQSTPLAAVQSTPLAAVQSTPLAAVQSTPLAAVQSTPLAAVQSTPLAAEQSRENLPLCINRKIGGNVENSMKQSGTTVKVSFGSLFEKIKATQSLPHASDKKTMTKDPNILSTNRNLCGKDSDCNELSKEKELCLPIQSKVNPPLSCIFDGVTDGKNEDPMEQEPPFPILSKVNLPSNVFPDGNEEAFEEELSIPVLTKENLSGNVIDSDSNEKFTQHPLNSLLHTVKDIDDDNAIGPDTVEKFAIKTDTDENISIKTDTDEKIAIAIKTDIGEKIAIKTDIVEKIAIKTNIDEKIAIKTDIGEKIAIKTNIGEKIGVKTDIGEKIVIKTDIGEEIAIKTNIGEKIAIKTDIGEKNTKELDTDDDYYAIELDSEEKYAVKLNSDEEYAKLCKEAKEAVGSLYVKLKPIDPNIIKNTVKSGHKLSKIKKVASIPTSVKCKSVSSDRSSNSNTKTKTTRMDEGFIQTVKGISSVPTTGVVNNGDGCKTASMNKSFDKDTINLGHEFKKIRKVTSFPTSTGKNLSAGDNCKIVVSTKSSVTQNYGTSSYLQSLFCSLKSGKSCKNVEDCDLLSQSTGDVKKGKEFVISKVDADSFEGNYKKTNVGGELRGDLNSNGSSCRGGEIVSKKHNINLKELSKEDVKRILEIRQADVISREETRSTVFRELPETSNEPEENDIYYSSESDSDLFDEYRDVLTYKQQRDKVYKMHLLMKRHNEVTIYLIRNSDRFSTFEESDQTIHVCSMCKIFKTNGVYRLFKHFKNAHDLP